MAYPTYLVTTGSRETIGAIESRLQARGFDRSLGDRSNGLLMPMQYRLWADIEFGSGEFMPHHTATLFWREEDQATPERGEH